MKIKKIILGILLAEVFSAACYAENLVDVYQQAFLSDPQFKAANAQWLANRETLPISVAALLPQISATGNVARQHTEAEGVTFLNNELLPENGNFFSNTASYSLMLTQPIFNLGSWATVWGAEATVKQAEATYLSAIESLMLRTSQAYFSVLLAQDTLRFTTANKEAVKRLLEQTQHRYDVGLIAITDLDNTKASYAQAMSDEIAAKKNLDDSKERLAEITGRKYACLSTLKVNFPLVTPQPADIQRWVKAAEKQNFDLAAASFASQAARETIKVKNAGHLPTLSGGLNYNYNYDSNNSGFNDMSRTKVASAGLNLNVPIFQGGAVVAQTRQAEYQYQQAISVQEQTHRSVVSNISQAYLGVMAGISKVKADKQLVIANESALRSTEAQYTVGTRTMVDVLKAVSDYYNSQKLLATDEYDFIKQTLLLKQLAAILSIDDLQIINSWLTLACGKTYPSCLKKGPQLKTAKANTKVTVTKKTTKTTATNKKCNVVNESQF